MRTSIRRTVLPVAIIVATTLATAAPAMAASDDAMSELPSEAIAIMESEPYRFGSWSWHAVDLSSDEEILSNRADEMALLGSTTKVFTVGTFYDRIGPDVRLTTPVHALGTVTDGTLDGDLVLVGAGDFILGSRAVSDTDIEFTEPDHVYWYIGPVAHPVEADPLAGLDELAAQVAAAGITSVAGDVLVDDRLWAPYESKEGIVTSIMVNDNLLDVGAAPGGAVGDDATLMVRPQTDRYEIVNEVTTVGEGETAAIAVVPGEGDVLVVSGQVPLDSDRIWTAWFAPDPSAYARALFIEALERAGVAVAAPLDGPVNALPAEDAYDGLDPVATLESPPAHVLGRLILKVSHNRGAETFMCLLAVSTGSRDCVDGLAVMLDAVAATGIDDRATFLVDGEGSDPSSATPRAVTDWLTWASTQPWADVYRLGMPDIGDDGRINAKSGTSAAPHPVTGTLRVATKAEAGYVETDDGLVVIAVYSMNGSFDDLVSGIQQAVADLSDVMIAIGRDL